MVELRRFLRAAKTYRVEYCLFPPGRPDVGLKESVIENLGGGGLLFSSPEPVPVGRQLVLRIHLTGWRQEGGDIVETADETSVAPITAVAKVNRCEFGSADNCYHVGVEFVGRILI